MRKPRGFTVLEMLVVGAVALVILVLLTDLFVTAMRRTQDGRLRVDMQQRAIFAVRRWEDDIERVSARSVVLKPAEPAAVSMTAADAVNSNGTITWSKTIVCWGLLREERKLIRDTYPPEVPAFAEPLTSAAPYLPTYLELDSLIKETSGAEKTMCEDVEEFSVADSFGGAELDKQPLVFKLKLRRPLSTAQNIGEFSIERRYTLRNSY